MRLGILSVVHVSGLKVEQSLASSWWLTGHVGTKSVAVVIIHRLCVVQGWDTSKVHIIQEVYRP
jgi:hypothetical protein